MTDVDDDDVNDQDFETLLESFSNLPPVESYVDVLYKELVQLLGNLSKKMCFVKQCHLYTEPSKIGYENRTLVDGWFDFREIGNDLFRTSKKWTNFVMFQGFFHQGSLCYLCCSVLKQLLIGMDEAMSKMIETDSTESKVLSNFTYSSDKTIYVTDIIFLQSSKHNPPYLTNSSQKKIQQAGSQFIDTIYKQNLVWNFCVNGFQELSGILAYRVDPLHHSVFEFDLGVQTK